jgi:flagellar M-ring protein FliF
MEQPLTTVSVASNQAASTETDQTVPIGRTGAPRRGLGFGRLIMPGATVLGLLGLFVLLLFRVPEPQYTSLRRDLKLEDSAAVVGWLAARGVWLRTQREGRAILLASEQAPHTPMTPPEEGPRRDGTVGNVIFDPQGASSTIDFPVDARLRRALAGEFAGTIASLAAIRSGRLHLLLSRHELFRRMRIAPSAFVNLQMHGWRRPAPRQLQAVQHLVAAAVPAWSPKGIVLIEDRATLLARGAGRAP